MITPLFKLSQDEEYLYVTITAPNLRLGEAELFYESTEFIFHAKPYYLRLELPGQLKPSERIEPQDNCLNEEKMEINPMKMKFDFDTNKLIVPVPKMNVGEHFADLEMIGKFLSGPKSKASHRLIEVLDSNQSTPLIDDLMNEEEDFDWNIEQKLHEQEGNIASLLGKEPYGFCNSHSGLLERLGQELTHDLVEIKAPGKLCRTERRKQRLAKEESDFSEDHYIADLFEPDVADQIDQRITAVAPWDTWNSTTQESILTDEDRQRMIDHLPKRDFLKYDSETSKALLLGVVDILYGYAYDLRAFDFEYTSESSWTIGKLSPTLSWFEHWTPIDKLPGDLAWASKDIRVYVLASCIRRALIYPLYRNWNLAIKVARDVATILSKGRSAILKCFLDMHRLFNETGDNYYLLNNLYIADYCCWLQRVKSERFEALGRYLGESILDQNQISKSDIGLDLLVTEKAAHMVLNESEDKIDKGMEALVLGVPVKELDSDDDEPN